VGHGSTSNAESALPTYQHADELRRRKIFGEVVECFWKIEPNLPGIFRNVFAKEVFVVPLFISEGYFTDEVIPRELGFLGNSKVLERKQVRERRSFHYCQPVGTHASMTEVILRRAAEVVSKHPFPRIPKNSDITLFIAGHGTGRNDNSHKAIERQVELIRDRNIYAAVHPAFMEEEPLITEIHSVAQTKSIVMVPFFISDGLHSNEDIPELLGENRNLIQERLKAGQPTWRNPTEKKGRLIWYGSAVGTEPFMADVILERVNEQAG